jgi:hypothetical protein
LSKLVPEVLAGLKVSVGLVDRVGNKERDLNLTLVVIKEEDLKIYFPMFFSELVLEGKAHDNSLARMLRRM